MVNIREATKQDIDILYDLINEIAKFHDQEKYVITTKKQLLVDGFSENPKFGALIAVIEERTVGYLSYTWNYSIWNGCDYMNLDDLFVLNTYRGKNVGQQLMNFAKKLSLSKGIKLMRWVVEKDNTKAINFYNKLGADLNIKGTYRWNLSQVS